MLRLASTFAPAALLLAAATAQDPKHRADDDALDRALAELPKAAGNSAVVTPTAQRDLGSVGPFTLQKLSFDLLFAAGASTERDDALGNLQGGGHDPRKRGFTLQNTELSLQGAVDPFFTTDLHLITFLDPIEGETVIELEEAFATTTLLPHGLELEIGQFFTEFGRHNPRHPHAWDFLDAPLIHTRVFGPDGIRAPGARLGWLTPLPWFAELHVGVQNASGETMASFLATDEFFAERAIGGRAFVEREVHALRDLVWLARFVQAFQPFESTTVQCGASGLFGPNAAGRGTATTIGGLDLVVRWSDELGGRQADEVVWQSEVLARDYATDTFTDEGDPLDPGDDVTVPGESLRDFGFYSQLTWRFDPSWRAGLRVEHAGGRGGSYDVAARRIASRAVDPFRNDRTRLSPLLEWLPSHFSRVRLQYNFDDAATLDGGEAHSVWLGGEFALGAHSAHRF
ncbi:MAG: hypothetical protein HZB39_01665 [Planctomycetes bacterium]|nr:hypothetical protein [Planctomycetota bacterium]